MGESETVGFLNRLLSVTPYFYNNARALMAGDLIETQEQIPQPAIPQRKKLSKNKLISIVVASIAVIVVIVLVAVSLSGTGMRSDQVKIVVIYSGDWHGWYTDGASPLITWSGHGETSIIVTRASRTATISALVMSDDFGSMGTITIKIIGPDGQTLDEDSADSAFNNVNVSWTPS